MADDEYVDDLPDGPRLTPAAGLTSLQELQRQMKLDARRIEASIALNHSMNTWISRQSPSQGEDDVQLAATQPRGSRIMSDMQPRKSRITARQSSMHDDCILSLEQAFRAHSSAFDLDGDGTICVEELIIIFERCQLFDDFFTKNKVRNYFNTWVEGCNLIHGQTLPFTEQGIGYQQFKDVLRWAADIKGMEISSCAQKVVRLSRKLCDKSASVQRRLEAVFDTFCKKDPEYMTAFEFGTLCNKIGVYEEDKFSMGDVYNLFYQINGVVDDKGINFDGFTKVLQEVGKRLEIGDDVFPRFARGVELMDTDEETITRVRMRLRQAAGIVGGTDWRQFFWDCDPDGQGHLDWAKFLAMCRDRLHLADRDNHLRILFDRLDEDGSGELGINELIHFITDQG